MILDRFLYCRLCNEVHHVTPFDRAPIYHVDGTTVREIVVDDRRDFLDKHDDHEIEKLSSVTENYCSVGHFADPMRVGYVEVTNGKRCFILRISRNSIADPMSYKIVSKQMMLWEAINEGDDNDL